MTLIRGAALYAAVSVLCYLVRVEEAVKMGAHAYRDEMKKTSSKSPYTNEPMGWESVPMPGDLAKTDGDIAVIPVGQPTRRHVLRKGTILIVLDRPRLRPKKKYDNRSRPTFTNEMITRFMANGSHFELNTIDLTCCTERLEDVP